MRGAAERADVLAYLRARRASIMARTVQDDAAAELARAATVEIEFIEQGLHEGMADGGEG